MRATQRAARRMQLMLSRETVAARLGITARRLLEWERGRYRPTEKMSRAWDAALFREVE